MIWRPYGVRELFDRYPFQLTRAINVDTIGIPILYDGITYCSGTILEHQIIKQDYLFEEMNASGKVLEKSYSSLTLRFSYRYEIQHLLELSGFQVENLYGDFNRNPFRHGAEQIWLTRKR